jgi:hypothetical protein
LPTLLPGSSSRLPLFPLIIIAMNTQAKDFPSPVFIYPTSSPANKSLAGTSLARRR